MQAPVRFLACAAALLFTFSASAHDYRAGSVHVMHPWGRATPAVLGGYMKLENEGDSADRLIGASSDVASKVELHTHAVDSSGVARMRQVDGVDIPAHQTVEFKPGGLHVMFMGLKRPLKDGEMVDAKLRFEKAGEVAVQFKIENGRTGDAAASGSSSEHMH